MTYEECKSIAISINKKIIENWKRSGRSFSKEDLFISHLEVLRILPPEDVLAFACKIGQELATIGNKIAENCIK